MLLVNSFWTSLEISIQLMWPSNGTFLPSVRGHIFLSFKNRIQEFGTSDAACKKKKRLDVKSRRTENLTDVVALIIFYFSWESTVEERYCYKLVVKRGSM